MPSILFVCTGNLYRSPLAEAFFRGKLMETEQPGHWVVESAGTWTLPGQPLPSETIRAAAKYGANLEGHVSQLVNNELLARFDLVLVMEKGHKEALDIEFPFARQKTHLLSEVVGHLAYDFPDPMNSGQEIDIVASDLYKMVERGYKTICQMAQMPHPDTGN